MGITHRAADFIIRAKASGVRFDRPVPLGRQAMFVSPVTLARMLKRHGVWRPEISEEDFYRQMFGTPFHADPFFRYLGANPLDTMDYAAYEGASVIHDLNQPV